VGYFCILALCIIMLIFTARVGVCGDIMIFLEFKIAVVRHVGLYMK